ncbi:type II toxin-antitoxin system Phd/YefM family antitoxin [Microbacterium karelineae]|uniref:type II toxin-antitoxin system Phd/YefM family antitoxin n=1 Tax=Microbacterium karelineae TaxID=2654283 RepID=UPI0012E9B7F7|nr:type II toxin-antitoxin system prevent-host-death family antitoxin [Microbacterium karelineae]
MKTISQRELRNDSAAVMRAVEAGESFTVARRGKPIAQLSPLAPQPKTFIPAKEAAAALAHLPAWGERDRPPDGAPRDPWEGAGA